MERDHLSKWELCWGGGLLSGDPKGYGEEGSGDGHHPTGVHSPGTLRGSCKGTLETGHLSL